MALSFLVPAHSDYLHLSIGFQLSQMRDKRQCSMSGSHIWAGCMYKQQQQLKYHLQVIKKKKGFFLLKKKDENHAPCIQEEKALFQILSDRKWYLCSTHTFRHNIWIKKVSGWSSLSNSVGAEAELVCTPWASLLALEAGFECSQSTGQPCRTGGWQRTGRGLVWVNKFRFKYC